MTAAYSGGELYRVGDRVLWFPGEHGEAVMCVARTRKGARCANDVDNSAPLAEQAHWWPRTVGDLPDVHHAAVTGPALELVFRRYEQQRCYVHVDADGPDHLPPEWEVFDPHRHRRTLPCPVEAGCRGCGLVVRVDQVLVPRLAACPACGARDWRDARREHHGAPGWRIVQEIPVDARPLLGLDLAPRQG